jgi:hypothetical protein
MHFKSIARLHLAFEATSKVEATGHLFLINPNLHPRGIYFVRERDRKPAPQVALTTLKNISLFQLRSVLKQIVPSAVGGTAPRRYLALQLT